VSVPPEAFGIPSEALLSEDKNTREEAKSMLKAVVGAYNLIGAMLQVLWDNEFTLYETKESYYDHRKRETHLKLRVNPMSLSWQPPFNEHIYSRFHSPVEYVSFEYVSFGLRNELPKMVIGINDKKVFDDISDKFKTGGNPIRISKRVEGTRGLTAEYEIHDKVPELPSAPIVDVSSDDKVLQIGRGYVRASTGILNAHFYHPMYSFESVSCEINDLSLLGAYYRGYNPIHEDCDLRLELPDQDKKKLLFEVSVPGNMFGVPIKKVQFQAQAHNAEAEKVAQRLQNAFNRVLEGQYLSSSDVGNFFHTHDANYVCNEGEITDQAFFSYLANGRFPEKILFPNVTFNDTIPLGIEEVLQSREHGYKLSKALGVERIDFSKEPFDITFYLEPHLRN